MLTLILLPGMDGTGDLFAPFLSALGREFDIITVRYPSSEALPYPALQDVARSALPRDRPFVLLGESFSGPIAVSLAASKPEGLVGLILCCSFVCNPRPWFSWLRFLALLLPVKRLPLSLLSWILLGRFSSRELSSVLSHALAQVSPAALRERACAVLEVEFSAQLSQIRVPTLYLRASEDRVVPRSASELFPRFLPQSRVVELAAPHFLLQAVPSEAAHVVRDFLHEVALAHGI